MSRLIEQKMNQAIAAGENMSLDNTTVIFQDNISFVYLHGNKIAEIGETWLRLYDGGWRTKTTKSRLNAILEENGGDSDYIFQRAGDWYISINGKAFEFQDGIELE